MKTAKLLIYLALIFAVIFLERKRPTEAVLWVLVLICIPYAGVVLYLVFGNTMSIKLTSCIRKKRLQKRYPDFYRNPGAELEDMELSDEDAQVMRFNSTYNRSVITSYEDLRIYTSGESHYRQLFFDIIHAKKCIYVEFYTIHHDVMGEAFVKALTEKARQGVTVFVLCDFVANILTPPRMFRPLREAGGSVIRVKPFLTHFRSHRKIVVIDHSISYIGGMNMGKQYANMSPKKSPWRDTQVRMTGPCTDVLESYFLTDWLCAIRRRDWNRMVSYVDAIPTRKQTAPEYNLCQFITGGVDTNKESVKMCYLSMIRSAKRRIRIQTPYFIPDASILDALKTAAAAGVEVELMIPGIKASFFIDPVTNYYAGELLEYGAKVYKYHGYIHAKTMVIDEELCCVGSVNMDMRSLMVDDEVCGVFYSNDLAAVYSAQYDRDMGQCDRYTYQQHRARSVKDKMLESVFLLFAPLM